MSTRKERGGKRKGADCGLLFHIISEQDASLKFCHAARFQLVLGLCSSSSVAALGGSPQQVQNGQ